MILDILNVLDSVVSALNNIISALISIPVSTLVEGVIRSLLNPVALAGILGAGWFLKSWWKAAILGALWMALVSSGTLAVFHLQLDEPRSFDSDFFDFILFAVMPFILVDMAAAASVAAIIVLLRFILKPTDVQKS